MGGYPLLLRRQRRFALRRVNLRFAFQVSHALERYLFLIPQLSQALFRISHSSFRVPTRQDDRASKENVLLPSEEHDAVDWFALNLEWLKI
jgi:hypothetical protein